tara:strand:+ start:657 stop:2549 length:1893 start_codon:yes stop_codon:yes gene_type:complete
MANKSKSIGLLNIVFGADLRGFDRAMKKAQRSIKKFGKRMERVGGNLTRNVTLPIIGLGAAAVKMASDFAETDAKFKTVFSSIQKQAEETADTFKKSFGLSEKAAKQLLGDTGDLLVGFGFTEKSALELSKQVNELAVDLASFTNFSGGAEGASLALTKALLGERESIKSLGIAITEADLKSFAAEQGLVFKELDRVGKATLTYQLALKQSSKAVGDFERTSGSLANQVRQMQAQLIDLSVEIGNQLLPIVLKIVRKIRDLFTSFTSLDEDTKKVIVTIGILAATIGPLLLVVGQLSIAMAALFTPGGAIMLGIIALGAGLVYVADNFEAFKERLSDWTWWKNALITAVQWVNRWNPINILIKEFNKLLDKLGMDRVQMPNAFEEVNKTLEKLKDNTKEYEHEFGSFARAVKNAAKKAAKALGGLGDFMGIGGGGTTEHKIPFFLDPKSAGLEGEKPFIGPLNKITKATEKLRTMQEEYNAAIGQFGHTFANAFSNALTSQEGFFKSFIRNLKAAVAQQLAMLAGLQIASALFGGTKLGEGLPTSSGLFSGLLKGIGNIFGFQNGGLVTGATMALVGEGSGTSISNPEVIAPLDKLKNYMGGDLRVTGRLVGNDIFLSNDKAGVSRNRFV